MRVVWEIEDMKHFATLLLIMSIIGCASITYQDKSGQKLTYSRLGSQSIKGLTVNQTVNGVILTIEASQSDTQALTSAVSSLSNLASTAAK